VPSRKVLDAPREQGERNTELGHTKAGRMSIEKSGALLGASARNTLTAEVRGEG
jgi:hypothetical protein